MRPSATRVHVGSGGVLYLVVTGVMLASGIYTQANLLFWGFGLMIGGLVFSVGMAAVALRGLEVTRLVPSHTATHEAMALRYRVHNHGWLPAFGLVIREGWGKGSRGWKRSGPASGHEKMLGGPPHAWVMHVSPRATTQAQAPCRPLRRGRLRFERIEIASSFPFGVISKVVLVRQPDSVLVFPALYRVRRDLLNQIVAGEGDGNRPVSRMGGTGEFFGLREYRPGDHPRTIDWKRTARTGTLVSRELTTPRPPRLSLVLDLREPPPMGTSKRTRKNPDDAELPPAPPPARPGRSSRNKKTREAASQPQSPSGPALEERAISLAASLICEGYLRGLRVGLRVVGPRAIVFPPRHSLTQRTQMLDTLAGLDLTQRSPLRIESGTGGGVDLIVWAGRGTMPTGNAAAPRRTRGGSGGAAAVVMGAVDFDDYVHHPVALTELDARGPASPPRRIARTPGSPATPGIPASPASLDTREATR